MSSSHAEEAPLLPAPNGHDTTTSTRNPPRWAFWPRRQRRSDDLQVTFVDGSGDEDDEDIDQHGVLATRRRRQRRRRRYTRVAMLLGVLLVGAAVGAAITRVVDQRMGGRGDEPMVPPVYTLPPPTGLPRNPAYLFNGTTAAVASEDITCSHLGLSILREKNGTAVDAAITTTLCIGLLNAFSSGIGGGGFMLVRVPEIEANAEVDREVGVGVGAGAGVVAIDFRETSPAGSEKEMYGANKAGRYAAQVGGLAIGVPGELRGLEAAHKLYGRLPWEDVVMPVAELARGWHVSRELAGRLRIFGQFMLANPTWSEVYAPQGYLAVEGDWIKRVNYGKTLERIAKEGPGAFYEGEIAENMVEAVKRKGGILSLDDLKGYKSRSYPAIHQTWNGKTIYTTSAPSSGGVMIGLLNLLEPYDLVSSGGLDNPLNVHRLIEAMKFAFGARSEVTDPKFAENVTRLDDFWTKEWADEIRPKITDDATHEIDYYGLQHDTPVDHGTTHLSVVDQWGGAASITSTVNLIWGSHVMDPKTGVIFNDEQDDFSVPGAADAFGLLPSPWNYPAPGKRPLSSTAATILENPDGTLYAILGGSGGSRIFPSIAQVLLHLAAGHNLSSAIEKPRYHNQVVPPITTIEVGPEGEDVGLSKALEEKGHKIGLFDINIGVSEIQAIVIQNGTVWASADSRKNGIAAAY